MPTIPKHWLDSDVAGMDEIVLPGGIVYDPMTGCITADGVCWEQPDVLALLREVTTLLREENKKLRDGLEKYRGQINQYGENTAANDLTPNA